MSGCMATDNGEVWRVVNISPACAFVGAAVVVGSFVPHRIRGLFDTLHVSALIHFVGDQRGRDNSYESATGCGSR